VVNTSTWHASALCTMSREDRHAIFVVKSWLSTLWTVYPLQLKRHVNDTQALYRTTLLPITYFLVDT